MPTIGGNISVGFEIMPSGGYDQRGDPRFFGCTDTLPLAARSDVLVFQTPPLDRDIEVTGPLVVRLWASSSAIDTDFTAKLVDVYPASSDSADGFALNLSDSIIRARYRKDRTRAEFLTPAPLTASGLTSRRATSPALMSIPTPASRSAATAASSSPTRPSATPPPTPRTSSCR